MKFFCFLVLALLMAIQAHSQGPAQAICLKNQPENQPL